MKQEVKYIYLHSQSLGGEVAILAVNDQVILALAQPQLLGRVQEAARELAMALHLPLLCCQLDDGCFCHSPEDDYPAIQDEEFDPYLILALADAIGYFCDCDGVFWPDEVLEAAIWSRGWLEQQLLRSGKSPCSQNIDLVLKTVRSCIGQEGGEAFMQSLFDEAMGEWQAQLVPLAPF